MNMELFLYILQNKFLTKYKNKWQGPTFGVNHKYLKIRHTEKSEKRETNYRGPSYRHTDRTPRVGQ